MTVILIAIIMSPTQYAADEGEKVARVTNEELAEVVTSFAPIKSPGPDGIPIIALKAAVNAGPDMFKTTMQRCIDQGIFPDVWRRQKLVLLPKPGKPPGDPLAYLLLSGVTSPLGQSLLLSLVFF